MIRNKIIINEILPITKQCKITGDCRLKNGVVKLPIVASCLVGYCPLGYGVTHIKIKIEFFTTSFSEMEMGFSGTELDKSMHMLFATF